MQPRQPMDVQSMDRPPDSCATSTTGSHHVVPTSVACSQRWCSGPPTQSCSFFLSGVCCLQPPALLNALQNMHLPGHQEWYMDSGASSHMASDHGILSSSQPSSAHTVTVGNGASLPISHIVSHTLPSLSKPLYLNNILVVPHIIKNLLSV